jgi:hypothetical protein
MKNLRLDHCGGAKSVVATGIALILATSHGDLK